jgi:homoserine kinase
MNTRIKVKAPASVANLGCGYDIIGLAIEATGDEILGRRVPSPGVVISKITGDGGILPTNPAKNTAGVAMLKFLDFIGDSKSGFEIEIHKKIAVGTGLGSSASSAAAGAMLANELSGRPLSKRELLPFAIDGEYAADGAYHADNVAPALLGGIQLIRDIHTLDIQRVYVPEGLYVTVVYPKISLFTREARNILNKEVALQKHIQQSANLAGLIIGFMRSDIELIGRSLEDKIIEGQRASLIPGFYKVKESAMGAGALGCSISGAGPSIFALSASLQVAEEVGASMQKAFSTKNIQSELFLSQVNQTGTVLC